MSAAHSGQHILLLAEQRPCLIAGVATMDNSPFTTKTKFHSGPVAVQLGCVDLLDTGSPQTSINAHALERMKRAGAASAICERHTPPRSWGGSAKSPPLQTSTAVRLSVQFFHDDHPTASLAVWAYVAPAEAMQHECFSDATTGSGSMAAPTVRWLPARAMLGFRERAQDVAPRITWVHSVCS